jgi:pteridine reductase
VSVARYALVTGGAVRLGRAICEGLAQHGFDIALHYNNSEEQARNALAAVEAVGRNAFSIQSDLTDATACVRLVDDVKSRFGALDVLVNSAASFETTRIGQTTSDQWDQILALNLRAPFLLSQAAAEQMRAGGCIVNIADLAGVQAWPSYLAHGAAKAALIHLTRSLTRALGPKVRVNAVAPGAVLLPDDFGTAAAQRLVDQTPLRRLGTPDDVVNAVRYLIDADFVTGTLIVVDGGRLAR